MSGERLLSVEGVAVDLPTPRGNLRAVDRVDLALGAGRTLGIVGESGCGKTMLSRAILQLLPKKAKLSGRVMFDGYDLARADAATLRKLRARSLAVVFQDPMTSLNPVLTIGTQLIETLQEHLELDATAARQRSVELLAADPELLAELARDDVRRSKVALTLVGDHAYFDRGGKSFDGPLSRGRV